MDDTIYRSNTDEKHSATNASNDKLESVMSGNSASHSATLCSSYSALLHGPVEMKYVRAYLEAGANANTTQYLAALETLPSSESYSCDSISSAGIRTHSVARSANSLAKPSAPTLSPNESKVHKHRSDEKTSHTYDHEMQVISKNLRWRPASILLLTLASVTSITVGALTLFCIDSCAANKLVMRIFPYRSHSCALLALSVGLLCAVLYGARLHTVRPPEV